MIVRCLVTVTGVVQGVGFRPFVYRLAVRLGLAGTVRNTPHGVEISLEGSREQIGHFLADFERELPPLASISERHLAEAEPLHETAFRIVASGGEDRHGALVPADVAVCSRCLEELEDPGNRRWHYAFINCTECGPRYTIVDDVPYDRAATSMVDFPMCEDCRREYDDPADRRFHAQATCCPHCGPRLSLLDCHGQRLPVDDPLAAARRLLAEGRIVAVKGVGGFHLAADATQAEVVEELRRRKGRGRKPFALMSRSVGAVRQMCVVSGAEEAELTSATRPIVVLAKRCDSRVAPGVAPGNATLGVMLPYAPVHHLLLDESLPILVMTSGNLTDEPIVIADATAVGRLGQVADAFLTNDRRILHRADDSIVKVVDGRSRVWRRSRGFVPAPLRLVAAPAPTLAVGGMMKNTVAMTRGRDVFISQHLGDTDSSEGLAFLEDTVEHLRKFLGIVPEVVAYDLHPDYLTSQFALALPVPIKIAVQHHEAHIASCQCEHGIVDRQVIGLAMDGTGYGRDGTIWGGEVFVGTPGCYRRAAHLETVPMPGGELAIRQPWRMAVSWLLSALGDYRALPLAFVERHGALLDDVEAMARRGLNAPLTSSCGRLFDAVSAVLGLVDEATFEGEPAVSLETAAGGAFGPAYGYDLLETADGSLILSPRQALIDLAADLRRDAAVELMAGRFHATLVAMLTQAAHRLRQSTGLNLVALGGGVFLNAILTRHLRRNLEEQGFVVYQPERVPPGDGGLSLGQIAVATAVQAGSSDPTPAATESILKPGV